MSNDSFDLPQPNKRAPEHIDKDRVPEYAPCVACGKRHSRVGEHVACLSSALLESRRLYALAASSAAEVARLRADSAELARIRSIGPTAHAMPYSPGGTAESRMFAGKKKQ